MFSKQQDLQVTPQPQLQARDPTFRLVQGQKLSQSSEVA